MVIQSAFAVLTRRIAPLHPGSGSALELSIEVTSMEGANVPPRMRAERRAVANHRARRRTTSATGKWGFNRLNGQD